MADIGRAIGARIHAGGRSVAGGSINDAVRFETDRGPVFVKIASPVAADMLAAEAAGLETLASAKAVRVPRVLATGTSDAHAWLALEWLDLTATSAIAERRLGEALAKLHGVRHEHFGWHRDNTIGSTPQRNDWCEHWVEFLKSRRLGVQLELARQRGAHARTIDRGQRLCEGLGSFFQGYQPVASLLHGDLWGGNWGVVAEDEPVIFDPAVYFGDREADIAMTRLFGGFGISFYGAYASAWPLDPGADVRTTLYNLYHVLNHYNLFGGGYLAQADAMIDLLLAAM
jgi:protein-ribulosamine 3-kinase